jgi:serine/threonine-protein kinase HipA
MIVTSNRSIYIGLALDGNDPVIAAALIKLARKGVVESGAFAYGKQYLSSADAIALNPLHLPLSDKTMDLPEQRLRDGGTLPLTIRDALPDKWGRLVLQSSYGKTLDDIDVLLLSNADRVGAMVFSETPRIALEAIQENLTPLEDLSEATLRLERQLEISPEMRRLLNRGGSLGGARPKATFIHNNQRWIAKFPAQGDDYDVELVEAAILELAPLCGITVQQHRLEKINRGHVLLIRRFDRKGNIGHERRLHYLSAAALLNVAYESNNGSYFELAQVLRKLSANPKQDLEQLYRRMLFNLVIDNTDDHVKNHGALFAGEGEYQLAPAFDVVMQLTNTGYQELAIQPGNHDASISLAKAVAPQFGIHQDDAEQMIQATYKVVDSNLLDIISRLGGDEILLRRVQNCLSRQRKIIQR